MYSNILYSFYFWFQGSSYISLKAYFLFLSQSYKFSISFLLYLLSVKLLHSPVPMDCKPQVWVLYTHSSCSQANTFHSHCVGLSSHHSSLVSLMFMRIPFLHHLLQNSDFRQSPQKKLPWKDKLPDVHERDFQLITVHPCLTMLIEYFHEKGIVHKTIRNNEWNTISASGWRVKKKN